MLAATERALVERLKTHRLFEQYKLGTADSLPKLPTKDLLARYVADAPALYVLPGRLRMTGESAVMEFTVAGVVRNVAGGNEARLGDGIDIGCDHLMLMAIRAINGQRIGICAWRCTVAEMVDDDIFDEAGIAAVEIRFEGGEIEVPADYELSELDDFITFKGDIDVPPHAGAVEYASWLQDPPNYDNSRPDAQLTVQLEGAP
jgi:hypothetical protein